MCVCVCVFHKKVGNSLRHKRYRTSTKLEVRSGGERNGTPNESYQYLDDLSSLRFH